MAIITNQATLTYNGLSVASNIVTGEIVEPITASKISLIGTFRPGDRVTYIINLDNTGPNTVTGLTVSDDLGAYTAAGAQYVPLTYDDGSLKFYINSTLQTAPTVTAGPPLTVTGIDIPAGGRASLVYSATLNGAAPLTVGSTVNNTATVSGGGLSESVTADATITVAEESNLAVFKSMSPMTVIENGEVTYTFLIRNYGNAEAGIGDNVILSDTFTPALDITSVQLNGTPLTLTTDYTYNNATGAFATVADVITVPAATFTQDPATGNYVTNPGEAVLTVTGTV